MRTGYICRASVKCVGKSLKVHLGKRYMSYFLQREHQFNSALITQIQLHRYSAIVANIILYHAATDVEKVGGAHVLCACSGTNNLLVLSMTYRTVCYSFSMVPRWCRQGIALLTQWAAVCRAVYSILSITSIGGWGVDIPALTSGNNITKYSS